MTSPFRRGEHWTGLAPKLTTGGAMVTGYKEPVDQEIRTLGKGGEGGGECYRCGEGGEGLMAKAGAMVCVVMLFAESTAKRGRKVEEQLKRHVNDNDRYLNPMWKGSCTCDGHRMLCCGAGSCSSCELACMMEQGA